LDHLTGKNLPDMTYNVFGGTLNLTLLLLSLCILASSSSHGVLLLSAAVSTTGRQVSRLVAFFHAAERPIFSGFKSASIERSQVWLGLPFGRFQSELLYEECALGPGPLCGSSSPFLGL